MTVDGSMNKIIGLIGICVDGSIVEQIDPIITLEGQGNSNC